jgi:hypothetical protein
MIKITNTSVMNFDNAIRGARNPMNSWAKGDSRYEGDAFIFGPNDLDLAKRLCRAGRDHRKFIRQIFVSVDIHAPLYWWKEFDTYKVGTVANSTSTMHKIHSKPFDVEDFSHDHLTPGGLSVLSQLVDSLEDFRKLYLETKDKQYWYTLIQLLPSSYNQLRTCTMNYENIRQIYFARKEHKLEEWRNLCGWMEELPYFKELFLE